MLADLFEVVSIFDITDGNADKAAARLRKAVEIRERLNGTDAPETAVALERLGRIRYELGDYEKAEPLLKRALAIRKVHPEKDSTLEVTVSCLQRKLGQTPAGTDAAGTAPGASDSSGRTIRGGVVNGKAIYLAKPAYPAAARAARESGAVAVQALIDESGRVIFACAISGPKLLQQASELAAYLSRFSPTTLAGQQVKVSGVITYNFVR